MREKYHYTRFKWWNGENLDKIESILRKKGYQIKVYSDDKSETELSIYKDTRKELFVTSDNVKARISTYWASLEQLSEKPFTKKDLDLRNLIFDHYPRDRLTPLPLGITKEPEYKIKN